MAKKVVVIGSGFAGLAAAAKLAQQGFDVTILEKNATPGGRARVWESEGFTFDMGPSWYWMPDVFEHFYQQFGYTAADFYELKRLSPSYRVIDHNGQAIDLPSSLDGIYDLFEKIEKGSAAKLKHFIAQAQYKYEVGIWDYAFRPSHSITEFADSKLLGQLFKMQLLTSIRREVHQLFSNKTLQQILEFPVLFLGSTPARTPALYSLMNYTDMAQGTWYPMGGMHQIVKAMVKIATEQGVKVICNQEVSKITVDDKKATTIHTADNDYVTDYVVAAADYAHVEQALLPKAAQKYTAKYWDNRELSPSSLLFYVGLNKKLDNVLHHNLFFDEDFEQHAKEIYNQPQWPSKPLFYMSCPSITDLSLAPEGHENVFFLIPVATGIEDNEASREQYWPVLLERLKQHTGNDIADNVVLKRSYAHKDFMADYHSLKGNAYGLANSLMQTAFLKPKLYPGKVKNLVFAGQLTVPGPGVPPSIISGQIAAEQIIAIDTQTNK